MRILDNKVILITGGTGSFGSAFLEECLSNHNPSKIIVYSRDENKQYELSKKVDAKFPHKKQIVRFFIGDIRDLARLKMAFRDVNYVIHAAALKHVPIAEYNPFECINTNVIGSQNVITAALDVGVERVIALSTDKAANPVNLYGASKLAADKIFVAANNLVGRGDQRFSVVRYGNVLGSRGSVIPYFENLLAQGCQRLPVTDERMTRFWITLEQGVGFVLSSFEQMTGGEIFVPKIPSMKIVDLANFMAPDVKLDFIGIRPGEKLHETMISTDDARNTFDIGDRYVVLPAESELQGTSGKFSSAARVAENFVYSSDLNSEWISEAHFHELMSSVGGN